MIYLFTMPWYILPDLGGDFAGVSHDTSVIYSYFSLPSGVQPNRTYNLEDPEGYALRWCKAINEVYEFYYGPRKQ